MWKFVSSLELLSIFDDYVNVTSVEFLLQVLIFEAVNLITLRLDCHIKSFNANIISNKNKFVIVSLQRQYTPCEKFRMVFFLFLYEKYCFVSCTI